MPVAVRSRPDACPGVFAPHDASDGALARIRLPGGAISAAALRVVADCADELGDGHLHLTSRGNLQLRGLARSGALVARLMAAGLLPSVTHERVRNVLASPLARIARDPRARAGVAPAGAVDTRGPGSYSEDRLPRVQAAAAGAVEARGVAPDVRAMAAALDRGLCARPGLAELPGRFLFALDDGRGDVAAEDPDLCWRAGTLLVAGVPAVEVTAADAVAALLDAAEAFLALRAADGGGAWRVAELADAPARIAAALHPPAGRCQESHLHGTSRHDGGTSAAVPGPVVRDDGGVALVVAPLLGELTTAQARLLADAGPTAVVTPWRTIVLPDPQVSAADLAAAGLVVEPGPAGDLSACAGRPGCAKALADVRADALAALGHLPAGRVHVSGCQRRCGAPRGPHLDAVALAGGGYLVDGTVRTDLLA